VVKRNAPKEEKMELIGYHDGFAIVDAAYGLGLEGVELEGELPCWLRGVSAAGNGAGRRGRRVVALGVGDVVHAGDWFRGREGGGSGRLRGGGDDARCFQRRGLVGSFGAVRGLALEGIHGGGVCGGGGGGDRELLGFSEEFVWSRRRAREERAGDVACEL